MLTSNVRDKLLSAKLTAAEWCIWCYLVSLDPFGDRGAKYSPAELMLKCGVKKTAYFKAKAKFQRLGLFDFKDGVTKVYNLQGHSSHSEMRNYSQQARLISSANAESQSANAESQSANVESQSANAESQSANAEFQPPKSLTNIASRHPQTIETIQTNQTVVGGGKTFSQESKDDRNQQAKGLKEKNGLKTIGLAIEQIPYPVVQQDTKAQQTTDIPQDLINKLEERSIPLDARVRDAIAKHHLSQAYSALTHIDNTRDSINNPRGVFLFQLPRQPLEKERGRVVTARDFGGYTLEHMEKMYPNNWREAAMHFGIEVPDEERTP